MGQDMCDRFGTDTIWALRQDNEHLRGRIAVTEDALKTAQAERDEARAALAAQAPKPWAPLVLRHQYARRWEQLELEERLLIAGLYPEKDEHDLAFTVWERIGGVPHDGSV